MPLDAAFCVPNEQYRSTMYFYFNYVHYTHDSDDDACMCYAAAFLRTGGWTPIRWEEGRWKEEEWRCFYVSRLLTHTYLRARSNKKKIPTKFVFVLKNLSHAVISMLTCSLFPPKAYTFLTACLSCFPTFYYVLLSLLMPRGLKRNFEPLIPLTFIGSSPHEDIFAADTSDQPVPNLLVHVSVP